MPDHKLSKKQLAVRLQGAAQLSDPEAIVTGSTNPFGLVLRAQGSDRWIQVRVYIWNLTHGGGKRLKDEYRIQRTGQKLNQQSGRPTLVLGWHEGFRAFAAFDIRKHASQRSSSPSMQIKESALLEANRRTFALYKRGNGEIAIAFQPQWIVDYALNSGTLHRSAEKATLRTLNRLDRVTDIDLRKIPKARREVVRTLRRKFREHDFKARVLSAYRGTCAMCGLQLGLVEAAHVLPVASSGSTDDTSNGIALCALHHRAYDRGLISFDERYKIEVSAKGIAQLRRRNLHNGLSQFRSTLRQALTLPADRRDHPNHDYVRRGRAARRWIR